MDDDFNKIPKEKKKSEGSVTINCSSIRHFNKFKKS